MPTRSALLFAMIAGLLAAGCRASMFDATVRTTPGLAPLARVTPESVREIESPPFGPGWQEAITQRVAAPYTVLADIDATSAGPQANTLGRERVRSETARLGGNAYVVVGTRRDAVGPYSRTHGLALRLLPPMPDARARCLATLRFPQDAGDLVVACREASRQAPHDADVVAREALAHLALGTIVLWDTARRLPRPSGLQADAAFGNASLAMARAAARDARWTRAARWLGEALPALATDSLRTVQVMARRLAAAPSITLRDSTAVDMALIGVDLAPSNASIMHLAADLLRDAGRARESFAVATQFAVREPASVDGWLHAGMAASSLGAHALAMRCFARVEQIDARYFTRLRMDPIEGAGLEAASRARVGRQPPAAAGDLRLPP